MLLCGYKAYVDPWSALNSANEDNTYKGSTDFHDRQFQISRYYEMYEDLLRMTRGYPNIEMRYIVAPEEDPPNMSDIPIFATQEELIEEV